MTSTCIVINQSAQRQANNEINWNVTLPARLRKVHRAYQRISKFYDSTDSAGFIKLAAALADYLNQPEPYRREYELKFAGVIND